MTIERPVIIRCKSDTCQIQVLSSGNISIGSVCLDPHEVDSFLATLREAINQVMEEAEKANETP